MEATTYQTARKYAHGHTFDQKVFQALAKVTREKLSGKEHNENKPKTAMRFEIDDWQALTFKPSILSSPSGWTMGDKIRLELRTSIIVQGKKGNGCDLILELNPDGTIRPRRWWKSLEKTQKAFEAVNHFLDLLAKSPEKAISSNKQRCAICGKKLTDPESQANGIGPECIKYFNFFVKYINGETETN